MKGIFSTFGSVKLPLLNCTENKMRSCFLFKEFYSEGFARLLRRTQLQKQRESDDQKVVLSADLFLNCNKGLFNDSCAFI